MTQATRKPKQTTIVCRELGGLLPKRGTVPEQIEVGSLTLTGAQVARMARVFVGDSTLTIQRLRMGKVAARTTLAPPGVWWVFKPDGTFAGPENRRK